MKPNKNKANVKTRSKTINSSGCMDVNLGYETKMDILPSIKIGKNI